MTGMQVYHRLWVLSLMLVLLSVGHGAQAQDLPDAAQPERLATEDSVWQVSSTPGGYTVWRQEINSGCLPEDHRYSLDIPADPNAMSDISYTMTNWDVDYNDPQECPDGPEVDLMYFNGHFLGLLTGASDSWSLNTWPLDKSQVVNGANDICIDTDAPATGCWCVGVGYIEVRAKVGFQVTEHTPQADDKNRDFHSANLDLTVTFSTEYDHSTLTMDTFRLEYRDRAGVWQEVFGNYRPLESNKFRFVPVDDLRDGIRYRATVKGGPNGVKSKGGAELAHDTVWHFWTVPNLDLVDNFDYGSGSVCPPSSQPCAGLELAAFQVARNAAMIPGGKPAVSRLYLRWKKHNDVHADDQVKALTVDASIRVDGKRASKRQTVKRPDRYSVAEKNAARNTVNIYQTPRTSFHFQAEVTPLPQTNATPVKYTASLNLGHTGRSPSIAFDYYFLRDGLWAGGVPPAARANGLNTMTAGVQYVTDQFPVLGTTFHQRGEHTIDYTLRANQINDGCNNVAEVHCPWFAAVTSRKSEWRCVYHKMQTMLGGHRFVAILAPDRLCPRAFAMALGNVFFYLWPPGVNESGVAHEVGHVYGISTAHNPDRWHRNDSNGVEGFQVRTKTNRSRVENPAQSTSLMHADRQPTAWIHNDDYFTLIANVAVSAGQSAAASASGPYLIVAGDVDTDTGAVDLVPPFLQELPNDPPSASGPCVIELLDSADTVLSSDYTTPETDLHIDGEGLRYRGGQAGQPQPSAASQSSIGSFSVSLPWDDAAQRLRITCDGTVLLTWDRSPNAPTVDLNNLDDGETLSGLRTLEWTGTDGPNLAYQLQFSADGGASWTPLIPLGMETTYELDTTTLPSGASLQLRIMVTDGFNTAYATRTVDIANPLTVVGVLPAADAVDVDLNTTVQALTVTAIDPSTLQGGGFQLLGYGSAPVDGTVEYDAISRMAIFAPSEPLQASTTYTASLAAEVLDVHGNSLGTTYDWSFTTVEDTVPPLVIATSPADGELDVPLNAVVQASFNEPLDPDTLTGSGLQLLDGEGDPVEATLGYDAADHRSVLIPAANLLPNHNYTGRVTPGVTDGAGNPLESTYEWHFTTGDTTSDGVRIVGNYMDQANDEDGDGLYDSLTLSVDVEVLDDAYYNLNGRLGDGFGELLEWQTTGGVYLLAGVHTLHLVFDSVPIRSNSVDGPYTLTALNFYHTGNPNLSDTRYDAYLTYPYDVTLFHSVVTLGGLPDQLLQWNTRRKNALNLRDYTTHETLPIQDVTYSIFINTDPAVGVSIDAEANIDIDPAPDTEAESDVTIRAEDPLGNWVLARFHISVQRPRSSRLEATYESTMGLNQSQQIDVEIYDQWDRLFTDEVTVTFDPTLGTVSPAEVTTSSGAASTTYTSVDYEVVASVEIEAGSASLLISIETEGYWVYVPLITRE